jgi:hypothetical protein
MDKKGLKNRVKQGYDIQGSASEDLVRVAANSILENLGYNLYKDSEVQIEVSVPHGSGTGKADYKVISGNEFFILEAKAPKVDIEKDTKSLNQLFSYIRTLKSKYGVLYNGKKLIVINENEAKPLYIWDGATMQNELTVFEALSKGNFPHSLYDLISNASNLDKLKSYLKGNSSKLEKLVIGKISEETKLSEEFISANTGINIIYSYDSELEDDSEAINDTLSLNDDIVLITPFRDTGPDTGINFVKKYNAWGFIPVKKVPKYLALYDADSHEISNLYEVTDLKELSPSHYSKFKGIPKSDLEEEGKKGHKFLNLGNQIAITKIPRGTKPMFQGRKYTTYKKFMDATTIDDL